MSSRKRTSLLLTLLALALAGALAWLELTDQGLPRATDATGGFLLTVLDVGQADSIFVKSAAGRTMLVDAGNERADVEKVVLPYLKMKGVTALDYLVLTHPDQDHVGGMPALLDGVRVGSFVDSVQPGITNSAYRQTLERVQYTGIKALRARRGRTDVDLGEGTQAQMLAPEDPLLTGGGSVTNNNSVVLRVTYGSLSVLLVGDIEIPAEERLLSHGNSLQSQILKVAHHGSQGSSSNAFLDAVKPEVALISVGAGNSYGHPQRAALQRLQDHETRVYRTDLRGTIEVTSDGRTYRVSTDR
jgi:competence protein ComEC